MRRRTTRSAVVATLAAATLLVASACSSDADDSGDGAGSGTSGQRLTLYSAGPGGLVDSLVEGFTEATGIEVDVFQGTTGEVLGRLEAESGNPQADVVQIASWTPAVDYKNRGLILPYEVADTDAFVDGWYDPDHAFYGIAGSALALNTNPDMAPYEPTDWADLAAEDWKGIIAMPDPRESGTARDLVTAMVAEQGDAAWQLFDQLFDNGMTVAGPNRPALDSVIDGVNAAVLGGVDYMGYGDIASGESLNVILPSSGTSVTPRPAFILESTENEAAAKAYLDYVTSAEAQQLIAERYLIPLRTDVPVADGVVPLEDIVTLDIDWGVVEETADEVRAEFEERYL